MSVLGKWGRIIRLDDVGSLETLESIKRRIESHNKGDRIPIWKQRLFFAGKELEVDKRRLLDYNIPNQATLFLLLLHRHDPPQPFKSPLFSMRPSSFPSPLSYTIYLTTNTDKIITIDGVETVGNIKAKIHEEQGIPLDDQCLLRQGITLDDSETLAHYHILDYKSLLFLSTLKKKLNQKMGIFVYHFKNKEMIRISEVESSDTIKTLKSYIKDKTGISSEQQRLFFQGNEVKENNTTLAQNCIWDGFKLRLLCHDRKIRKQLAKRILPNKKLKDSSILHVFLRPRFLLQKMHPGKPISDTPKNIDPNSVNKYLFIVYISSLLVIVQLYVLVISIPL